MGQETFHPSVAEQPKAVETKTPKDKEKQERRERRRRVTEEVRKIEKSPQAKHYCDVVKKWVQKNHPDVYDIMKEKMENASFGELFDGMVELNLNHNPDLVKDVMEGDAKERDEALITLGERTLAEIFRFEKEISKK